MNCVRTEATALTAMDPDFQYSGEFRPLGSETGVKFILLGTAAGVIETFNMKIAAARFLKQVRPTLSPKDPNFPAWWEAHKAEWEAQNRTEPNPHGKSLPWGFFYQSPPFSVRHFL